MRYFLGDIYGMLGPEEKAFFAELGVSTEMDRVVALNTHIKLDLPLHGCMV